jgi:hypothetical protein
MSLSPFRVVLVRYDDALFHERLLCGQVAGSEWVICTPDFDFYVEQLDLQNVDLSGIRFYGSVGGLPVGIAAGGVYCFPPATVREIWDLVDEGRQLAIQERQARGIGLAAPALPPPPPAGGAAVAYQLGPGGCGGPPVGPPPPPPGPPPGGLALVALGGLPPPPPPPVVAAVAAPGGEWVVDEPTLTFNVGDRVALPPGSAVLGDRALCELRRGEVSVLKFLKTGEDIGAYTAERKALLAEDRRTLPQPVVLVSGSEVDLIREMKSDPTLVFPNLEGPRTVEWLVNTVAQSTGAGFASRHHRWIRESGIAVTDRSTFEHQLLSKVLESAIAVDRVNVMNMMSMELLCRRIQLIEEVHAENPQQPSWEGAGLFMGWSERRGGALLAPSLRSHVAGKMAADSAIQKEKRKARESRKGDGKGKKKDKAEE